MTSGLQPVSPGLLSSVQLSLADTVTKSEKVLLAFTLFKTQEIFPDQWKMAAISLSVPERVITVLWPGARQNFQSPKHSFSRVPERPEAFQNGNWVEMNLRNALPLCVPVTYQSSDCSAGQSSEHGESWKHRGLLQRESWRKYLGDGWWCLSLYILPIMMWSIYIFGENELVEEETNRKKNWL